MIMAQKLRIRTVSVDHGYFLIPQVTAGRMAMNIIADEKGRIRSALDQTLILDAWGPYNRVKNIPVTFYRAKKSLTSFKWQRWELFNTGKGWILGIRGRRDLGGLGTKDKLLILTKDPRY